jgi:hypothetical protein
MATPCVKRKGARQADGSTAAVAEGRSTCFGGVSAARGTAV